MSGLIGTTTHQTRPPDPQADQIGRDRMAWLDAQIRAGKGDVQPKMGAGDTTDIAHGTVTGYQYRKCRCGSCRAAYARYRGRGRG